MDARCRFRPFLGLYFFDGLANLLDRMVRRTVVDDDDFQFVRRIELVHSTQNRPPNPRLFVETRHEDGDTWRIVGINLDGPVKGAENIFDKQERTGNDTIEI